MMELLPVLGGTPGDDELADAIVPPLQIGGDERRMQVRAYNYWSSLLHGRQIPLSSDFDPAAFHEFATYAVLLDFTCDPDTPLIVFLGEALARECDIDLTTLSIADVPRRSLLSRLTDHYLQIIANRAPIGFEAEFQSARGQQTAYRGILMPFSLNDDTIDFMFGVINWKEVASEEPMNAQSELGTHPSAPRRVPAWQDGPHAKPIAAT